MDEYLVDRSVAYWALLKDKTLVAWKVADLDDYSVEKSVANSASLRAD